MDSNLVDTYYELERKHWWFKIREKILRYQLSKRLSKNQHLKILNLGAASGRTTELLEEFGEVVSVEIDSVFCEFLREKLKKNVIQASASSLPIPNQSFDVICAFDVIEHVKDDNLAIMEMNRVCKPGGHIFITVPAYAWLWSNHDLVNQHYRRYTFKSLRNIIEPFFKIEYSSYFNAILFPPIAIYRTLKKNTAAKKGIQSDFSQHGMLSKKIVNLFFEKLFGLEVSLLKHVRFPFGISLLVVGKKK